MKRYEMTVRTKKDDFRLEVEAKSPAELRRRIERMATEGVWLADDDWCPPYRIKRVFFADVTEGKESD